MKCTHYSRVKTASHTLQLTLILLLLVHTYQQQQYKNQNSTGIETQQDGKSDTPSSSNISKTAATAGSSTGMEIPSSLPLPLSLKFLKSVHIEDITGPKLLYESLGAITFEFRLPDWIQQRDKLLIYDQKCSSDEIVSGATATSYTCPVFYYLHKIRDGIYDLNQVNRFRHRFHASGEDTDSETKTETDTTFDIRSCYQNHLSPHFNTFSTPHQNLDHYSHLLSKCVHGLIVKNEISHEFTQSTLRIPYAMMMSNYLKHYFKFLPTAGRVDLSTLLNTATIYNTLGLTHFLAETAGRWKEAVNDCKLNTIPSSLISEEVLLSSLNKLKENLVMKQMELVLPVLESPSSSLIPNDIHFYFKEKIADCVFTNNSLFVRILIPIKKQGVQWHSYKVTAAPFIQNENNFPSKSNQQTQRNNEKDKMFCYIRELESPKYFVADKTSMENHEQNCQLPPAVKQSRFCLVQDKSASISNFRKSCASKILNQVLERQLDKNENKNKNDVEIEMDENNENYQSYNNYYYNYDEASSKTLELLQLCKLACEEFNQFEFPVFSRIASDKFSIVGRGNDTIVAQLDSRVKIINPVEEGLLQVTLPCKGVLLYKQSRFYAVEPCSNIYKLVHVQN